MQIWFQIKAECVVEAVENFERTFPSGTQKKSDFIVPAFRKHTISSAKNN